MDRSPNSAKSDYTYGCMVNPHAIDRLVDEIARLFKPEQIILFGSYASGVPTLDSDVDLLILMPHRGPGYLAASRVRVAVEVDFAMDLLVYSPAELRKRVAMNDFFLTDIIEHGLVLHDSNDRRVGEQGRRRLRRRLHPAAITKAQPV